MKHIHNRRRANRQGFTLIEMIGVLAIIAVLAGVLLPRIFEAMNDARINSAAMSYNTAKSASMGYFGKFNRFGTATGAAYTTPLTAQDWGSVLLATGYLEKPYATKISGTNSQVQIISANDVNTAATGGNAAYNFDGAANTTNSATGSLVVQVHLTEVDLADARALSRRIDGDTLSAALDTDQADLKGKVKYDFAAAPGEVLMYVAHK